MGEDDDKNKRKYKKKSATMMKNNHICGIDQLVAYVFVIYL